MPGSDDFLGKVLILRTTHGQLVAIGRCVAYCDAPTIAVRNSNGEMVHWRADLTEVLTVDSEIAESLFPQKAGPEPPPVLNALLRERGLR